MIQSAHLASAAKSPTASRALLVDLGRAHRLISINQLHSRHATRHDKHQSPRHAPRHGLPGETFIASRSLYRMWAYHRHTDTEPRVPPVIAVPVEDVPCYI